MDRRGYLRVIGRLKDMVIRGGENIYPREIEEILLAHPAVADVAVVGAPDETWGEEVAAVVLPASGIDVSPQADQLYEFCRSRLAAYKCPRLLVLRRRSSPDALGQGSKASARDPDRRRRAPPGSDVRPQDLSSREALFAIERSARSDVLLARELRPAPFDHALGLGRVLAQEIDHGHGHELRGVHGRTHQVGSVVPA